MAISTLDQYIAAAKQRLVFVKTGTRTTVALTPFSVFDLAGQPGAGTLAGTSTAAGVVPDDTTAGCPAIDFSTGTGYLSKVEYNNSLVARLNLFDMVFKAGAYAFTGQTNNLSSQPSISSRCPDYTGGSTFGNGMQIWIEVTTSFVTGNNWQVQCTYTNQAGTTGRSTVISAAQAASGLTQGKMFQLALQAGDSGVQKIESVIVTNGSTAMTAGNFNVLILRQIWGNRVAVANNGNIDNMLNTGMPIVYSSSALFLQMIADGTNTGLPNIVFEIASA